MIKIRKATHKDVEKISSLWCEFIDLHERYDNYYKRAKNGTKVFNEFINKQISDRNSLVLVGITNKIICAYLSAKIDNRPAVFSETKYGFISDIAVAEKYRRQGIGEKLYYEAIEWFRKRKIIRIELTVATSNPISMKFWSKLGFKPYSERRFIEIDN
jgi:ribosomal protein S18 acetylase RimI-like enzyme